MDEIEDDEDPGPGAAVERDVEDQPEVVEDEVVDDPEAER